MLSSETTNNKTVHSVPLKRQQNGEMHVLNHELRRRPRMWPTKFWNWNLGNNILPTGPYSLPAQRGKSFVGI